MKPIEAVHGRVVFGRRIRRLAKLLADLIPSDANVLDIGCGDGALARRIMEIRPDVRIRGVEVIVRQETHIHVEKFDGVTIPFGDQGFDAALLVDVLHHLEDPNPLLKEAGRIAPSAVIIKDHLKEGFLADRTLRFMDEVGNARFGIPLPFTFWTRTQWDSAFKSLGMEKVRWDENLGLYPWPASLVFDRSLHFVARLALASI